MLRNYGTMSRGGAKGIGIVDDLENGPKRSIPLFAFMLRLERRVAFMLRLERRGRPQRTCMCSDSHSTDNKSREDASHHFV